MAEAPSGTENLEVMAEAVAYNAFLLGLIADAVPPAARTLDFGAGRGTFAGPLRAAGRAMVCVEPDPTARAALTAAGLEAHADLTTVAEGSLDACYSLNVLEHVADDAAVLAALHARLRPGAPLVLYVPAFQMLYSAMDARVGHLRRYRKGPLVRLVEDAGFVVRKAAYVDSLGFLASLAYRWLGRADGAIDRKALRTYDRYVFPLSRRLDSLVGPLAGKNVAVWAYRPDGPSPRAAPAIR
jgi:SAM-dependent methyltransferase